MCPFIGFSLDYAAESQIFETKGKKFYFKRNPQKCGIPQNEISHQKQDISSHIWIIYLHGCIFELFLVVLFFLIIFVSVLWTILNDWKFVFDSQSTVRRVLDTLTIPGNAIYLPQKLLQHLEVPNSWVSGVMVWIPQ